jgi:protein-tyrosine phosphatase
MSDYPYSREFSFDAIINFRDLGGYQTHDGHQVAWRKLFRSGDINGMTGNDLGRLKADLNLTTVVNLVRGRELLYQQEINLLNDAGIKYFSVPFLSYRQEELQKVFSNMGEVYLFRVSHTDYVRKVIEAMYILAEPANHPLLFHCGIGKDRSGLLAAFVLSILGVADADIINDYCLSAQYMKDVVNRIMSDPGTSDDVRKLPAYTWEAAPESMELLLSTLKREYGSIQQFIVEHGAEPVLIDSLKRSLLKNE